MMFYRLCTGLSTEIVDKKTGGRVLDPCKISLPDMASFDNGYENDQMLLKKECVILNNYPQAWTNEHGCSGVGNHNKKKGKKQS